MNMNFDFPMPIRGSIYSLSASALLLVGVSAQETILHPRGLFETPQEGLDAPLPQTASDAESLAEKFHLSLSSSVRYDDNIFLTHTGEESDVIFSVSPTLRFSTAEEGTAANTLSITYTPSYRIYADHTERNTLDHYLRIRLSKRMPKTQLGFNVTYQKSTGSDRYVSGTIDRDSLRTEFTVSHILTGKTRIDASAYYRLDNFGNNALYDDSSYGGQIALMYQATGKITIGPYVSYGVSDLGRGSNDHEYYGYGARFTYDVSGKTTLTGSVGYSVRSFSGAGASNDYTNATWRIGFSHAISAKTNIRASVYRGAKASYNFADSGYLATGLALSATYQASSRLSYYSTFVYENDDYFKTGAAGVNLDNDYYAATLGLRYRVGENWILGANATYRVNQASETLNDFNNLNFGINAAYTFW